MRIQSENKTTKAAPAAQTQGPAAAQPRSVAQKPRETKSDGYTQAGKGSGAASKEQVLDDLVKTRKGRKPSKAKPTKTKPTKPGGPENGVKLRPDVRDAMRKAFERESAAGRCEWRRADSGLPVGPRYVQEALSADGHVDGFRYTALVPAGSLRPSAVPANPNQAQVFYVQRQGGIAGLTQIAGPFPMPAQRSAS